MSVFVDLDRAQVLFAIEGMDAATLQERRESSMSVDGIRGEIQIGRRRS